MSEQLGSVAEDFAPCRPDVERRASVRLASTAWASYHVLGNGNDTPKTARIRDVCTLGVGLILPSPTAPAASCASN